MHSEEAPVYQRSGSQTPNLAANGLEQTLDNQNYVSNCQSSNANSNLRGLKGANFTPNDLKNQRFEVEMRINDLQRQIENLRSNPRKVVQITIYYDDSTFETFIPKDTAQSGRNK